MINKVMSNNSFSKEVRPISSFTVYISQLRKLKTQNQESNIAHCPMLLEQAVLAGMKIEKKVF